MTCYNHNAVLKVYPNVTYIEDNYGVFDADGNPVELDQALLDAAAIEIEADAVMRRLREKRDSLLNETDWVTLKAIDAFNDGLGIQLPQVWVDYRQALRDLPANTTDPANPVWPTKP